MAEKKGGAEATVRTIRRVTRKKYSVGEAELPLPMGSGAPDRPIREVLQPPAVPRLAGQGHAGGRLLPESQGAAIATRGDQTQNAGGAASAAHPHDAHGRTPSRSPIAMTAERADVVSTRSPDLSHSC
jgi:hypothetical protein